jgi:tetratricopeptide (TPR) repeat protein
VGRQGHEGCRQRRRAPILPVAIALAASTVCALAARLRAPGRASAALALVALGALRLAAVPLYGGPSSSLRLAETDVVEERHRGLDLFAAGRYDEAAAVYRSALATHEDPSLRLNLANALQRLGRIEEAAAEYRRVLAADPRDAVAWYDYGNLLRLERDDYPRAEDAYRRALEVRPRFAEAHFNLGSVLHDEGHDAEAATELERALELAPPDARWRPLAEPLLRDARGAR